MSSPAAHPPSPQLFFETVNSYQRTEALKAAIELEVFTAIGEGKSTAAELAERCGTALSEACVFFATFYASWAF
jgi:hypothetical protein